MSEKKREEIQGELDGLMSRDPATGAPSSRDTERGGEDAAPRASGAEATPRDAEDPPEDPAEPDLAETPEEEAERLSRALEMLEERVSLLLERHSDLLGHHAEAVEELSTKTERLDRLRGEGMDPEQLNRAIQELEGENERLSRHAAFLEGRIESLLNRVRYVVES